MDVNGLVYLLAQAGSALAQANDKISALQREIQELHAQLANQEDPAQGR